MKILSRVLDEIEAQARELHPAECCGILLAPPAPGTPVDRLLPAENKYPEDKRFGYELGPKAHLEAVRLECAGEARIAGYYHSHPQGTVKPSERDVNLALIGVTYLIAGIDAGKFRHAAWRLEGGSFVPEPLEVID